jgi:uncharacterized protein (DUF362 family)
MLDFLHNRQVALVKESASYPADSPYDPSESYPEWPGAAVASADNPAYRGVRQVFRSLNLDLAHADSPDWNPLGDLIRPGNTVVIKPNLVSHRNIGAKAFGITDTSSLITHGSVIRAIADYVGKALAGRGKLIVGDCPVQGTDWNRVADLAGLPAIERSFRARFPGVAFEVRDFRLAIARTVSNWVASRSPSGRSLSEYVELDLGPDSLLVPLIRDFPNSSFGVAQYPRARMKAAHSPDRNAYLVARDLLTPDVFISVPKLKAHQKAGITCALKNLVGINGHKDYLPHFRYGSPKNGGDEYPDGSWLWDLMWSCYHMEWERERGIGKRMFRALSLLSSAAVAMGGGRHFTWLGGGSWHGNDTIWRTVLDLNRLFFYYDRSSDALAYSPRQDVRYLAIVDGLIGGDKESPLAPSPVPGGWLLGGGNPAAVDAVATACIGFDIHKTSLVRNAFQPMARPLAAFGWNDIRVKGIRGVSRLQDIYDRRLFTPFTPSQGFLGHIEFEMPVPAAVSAL